MKDLVEYFWDEYKGIAEFVYEDIRTGELTVERRSRPLQKPEVTDATRDSYFANLNFWLQTQPLYD